MTVEEKDFLRDGVVGGVLLFSRNYESVEQLIDLVESIQALKKDQPFYIAVDNEGGRVFRFKKDFSCPPPMYDLARLNSVELVVQTAQIMAEELCSCGVNINFAPVCDIWNNEKNEVIGDRAFGKDHQSVSRFAPVMVRELQKNGVLACAKHFPGHGCTLEDSHDELPVVVKKLEEFRANEFIPFHKAIESGVEFVMMAHMVIGDIEEGVPASLSEKAHRILREELKFEKLIIGDDMQMKAVFDHHGVEEGVVAAIKAGTDIIEFRDSFYAQRALEGLKKGVRDGAISTAIVSDRLLRVLNSKKRYFSVPRPLNGKGVGTPEKRDFMDKIREKIAML